MKSKTRFVITSIKCGDKVCGECTHAYHQADIFCKLFGVFLEPSGVFGSERHSVCIATEEFVNKVFEGQSLKQRIFYTCMESSNA